jgi:hypothetical protein
MTSPTVRKLSAAALAAVGVIHLVLSPEYLSQQAYIGVLFIAGGLFLCALAVRLWRADDIPSWLLGSLTMAGMGIAFVLSRTTGLPGFHESEWELSGLVTLVLEAGFVAAAIPAMASPRVATGVGTHPATREPRFERDAARGTDDARRGSRVNA